MLRRTRRDEVSRPSNQERTLKDLRAVLFDMDGTLVDTLTDIAAGMNAALSELHLQPLSVERIGTFVGKGPRALAMRVLDEQPSLDPPQRAARVDVLLAA